MLPPAAVFIDGMHIKASANLKKKIKQETPVAAKRYQEELLAEVNAEREVHGKKPFSDDDDAPPKSMGKKRDNTSKKKQARRKKGAKGQKNSDSICHRPGKADIPGGLTSMMDTATAWFVLNTSPWPAALPTGTVTGNTQATRKYVPGALPGIYVPNPRTV